MEKINAARSILVLKQIALKVWESLLPSIPPRESRRQWKLWTMPKEVTQCTSRVWKLLKVFSEGFLSFFFSFFFSFFLGFFRFLSFKKKTSTCHALFTLQSTTDHFLSHGSNVYVAYLDCTKAFDRISHYGLFSKLIKRKIPLCILMCLIFWYLNMSCCVKRGTEMSREFAVPLGINKEE